MAGNKFEIELATRVTGNGLKKAAADVKAVKAAAGGAAVTTGELERELKSAETALRGVATGSKEFAKLRTAISKAKEELKRLKLGNLDTKGLDRASTRLAALKARAEAASKATRRLAPSLAKANAAGTALSTTVGVLPGQLGAMSNAFVNGGAKAGLAAASILTVVAALKAVSVGIGAASQQQQLEVSFDTLLGGLDNAKARLAELSQFSTVTPFKLPEVAKASKILETLTKGALSTGKGLGIVGDLAANTGEDFALLAVHVGRLYDGLQNGRAVGEAQQRLQELGIISASTRSELELLQKQGKKGEEVWSIAAKSFERFSGEMGKQSKTLKGALSTTTGGLRQLLGTLARPLTNSLADHVNTLNSVLGLTLESSSKLAKGLVSDLTKPVPKLQELTQAYFSASSSIGDASESSAISIGKITDAFTAALSAAQQLAREQAKLADAELGLKLEEIEGSGLGAPEKEAAKAAAREAARVATYQRGQALIRSELQETAALRQQLESEQQREAVKLANIEIKQASDKNLLELAQALDETKRAQQAASSRVAALSADRKERDESTLPSGAPRRNKSPILPAETEAIDLVKALGGRVQAILEEAVTAGLEKASVSDTGAIESAKDRVSNFSSRKLTQETALGSVRSKLGAIDDGPKSARVQTLTRSLANNEKVEAANERQATLANRRKLAEVESEKLAREAKTIKAESDRQTDSLSAALEGIKQALPAPSAQKLGAEIDAAMAALIAGDSTEGLDIIERASQSEGRAGDIARQAKRGEQTTASPAQRDGSAGAVSAGERLIAGLSAPDSADNGGDDKLLTAMRTATDALRDGATVKEIENFAAVAKAAALQTEGNLRALANSTIVAGASTAQLLQTMIAEQAKMASKVETLAGQIKNLR